MFIPYDYQKRVLKAFAQRKNIILVIPTGGGKTDAARLPFLQSQAHEDGILPGKAIYAVPMRVLATQFQAGCKELQRELNPDLFLELEKTYWQFDSSLYSLQTGETPEDPQFESMVVSCTIDQLLASALGVPYSIDSRKANINAGAIASSYLILDEPHLYPLSQGGRSYKGAFTTTIELLRLLKDLTRFIFMSATISSKLVERLSQLLDAEVITVDDKELAVLNKERGRTWERSNNAMKAEDILSKHDHCSLVVCNTVQRAQTMYLQLHEAIQQQGRDIDIRLLHSRFTDEDRQQQSKDLQQLLGKHQWNKGIYQGNKEVIVVATQVIEVGLDISVQVLHTELAPVNSIIQRAGRCARFESQRGRVLIYPLPQPDNPEQKVSTLPYAAHTCEETWRAIARFDQQSVGFREEQQLIDIVHTEADLDLLQRYEAHRDELQKIITKSLQTNERSDSAELIRDITQVQLLIHNTPELVIQQEPWRWQSFSFHPSLLLGKHWDNLSALANSLGLWTCKKAVLAKEEQSMEEQEEDNHKIATYTWDPVTSATDVLSSLVLAMPNQLVTYDKDLGLVFLDGRLPLSEAWKQRLREGQYQSALCERRRSQDNGGETRQQTYETHIEGLANAYHYAIYHELAYTMNSLEQLLGLLTGTIDYAIQLAIATHDLGKLDDKWQRWARAWQRLQAEKTHALKYYVEPARDVFLAKTDYDYRSKEQREWQKTLAEKRPKHSCEGVMIGRSMLMHSLNVTNQNSPNLPVARAICSAITHHHTPRAHEYGKTNVNPMAQAAVEAAITKVCRDGAWKCDLARLCLSFDRGDLFPENASKGLYTKLDLASGEQARRETWLALLIVRALRLADQRADRYIRF